MATISFPARRLGLFALLSTADFLLTRHLLTNGSGAVYEGNPVAEWWLTHYGWMGLATFKMAAVGCVVLLGVVIYLRRPVIGRHLLGFGCLTLAGVVLYSTYLVTQLQQHREQTVLEEKALRNEARLIDSEVDRSMVYHKELVRITDDFVAHRCSLTEAAARLEASERGRELKWRQILRRVYQLDNDSECFAASIVNNALQTYFQSSATWNDGRQFLSEYRSAYGHECTTRGVRVMVN